MGEPRYGNIKKLAWGSLWELTLFCERPTHHPFSCQSLSFYLLKPLPPRSWYMDRIWKIFLYTSVFTYGYDNLLYGIPCVTAIFGQSQSVFSSFRKQTLLCWLSGKLHFGGHRTRKRILQKVQRVCGVELTCIKNVFLHLKYPAGREPDSAELHTLSSSLNKHLHCHSVWWRNQCYSSPAGVDVWS